MFLSRRSAQAEYFDGERPAEEVAAFSRSLQRVNRLFDAAEPFRRFVPRMLSEQQCRQLSILDLGAGDGSLGKELMSWAARHGWDWRVTNLDMSPATLKLNPTGRNVTASVLALPFASEAFDLVMASQMTHHLSDSEATQHLREAWRVARRAIFLSDLHRNAALYCLLWLLFRFQRHAPSFRADGLLSVKRSWRVPELKRCAEQAGLDGAAVKMYFGARVLLMARKPAASSAAAGSK